MRVYHGVPSAKRLTFLRDLAPSVEHGAEWLPTRLSDFDVPCILDNGAYGGDFDRETWVSALDAVAGDAKRTPDFVVLPDVFKDWDATTERHLEHVEAPRERGLPFAVVAQPPATADDVARLADRLGTCYVFVGGGKGYTYSGAGRGVIKDLGESYHVHVGEPGQPLARPFELGASSVDSVAGTRRRAFDRFRRLEKWASGEGATLLDWSG